MKLNKAIILKSFLIGLFLTVEGMVLQVLKGQLVFRKAPPQIDFIVTVSVFYILTGFLFSLGYFMVKDSIPGKTRAAKGAIYALLVYFAVALGNFIGVIGQDFKGGYDLLTSYKLESYCIALIDGINFLITGIVLGTIAEKKPIVPVPYRFPGRGLLKASIIGFFLFPVFTALCFKAMTFILPTGYDFTTGTEVWFYMGSFIPLAITGAGIPIFFDIVRGSFSGSVNRKALKFFLYYFMCFWIINIAFGLPFGLTIPSLANALHSSVLPIILLLTISVKTLRGDK